ncbi:MAG: dihydroorotase [Candidatus Krumholzibacteria bacterium]|nr:dihydroorotase [Candidatus Krumholzibacteria bacterium]
MIDWKDKREFWITGARVADPESGRLRAGSVCVQKGIITEVAWQRVTGTDLPVLEAEGYVLAPGFIDIHTHLREPGYEEKETIKTGTAAAVAGGYTSIVCMANTDPVIDVPSVVEFILREAERAGSCRVFVTAALTRGLEGEIISEYNSLKEAGAVALSDDGNYVTNSQVMRSALEYARFLDLPVISHCEDRFLSDATLMNEGYSSTRLGMRGSPAAAEEIAVARDIRLSRLTGARLHIAHISTAGSVELVKQAKKSGIPVTAEVTPHHLTMEDTLLESFDTSLKTNPPLRGREDIEALRAGLEDGTIDCIATDHAPHNVIDKEVEFDLAPPGMIGLETAFALLNTRLVQTSAIGLIDLIRLMTSNPARVLGLPGGRMVKGEKADLVLLDPEAKWAVEAESLRSKSRNTPLVGTELAGRVKGVFLEGKWINVVP